MTLRKVHILLPILVFMLTGCFRQASQPLDTQLTSNTAMPTDPIPFDDPDDSGDTAGDPDDDTNSGGPTPIITMIMSTPIVPATQPPPDDPDDAGAQSLPEQSGPVPLVSPTLTATRQIITPGAPSGPSAITTPTPFDDSAEATPSGLVTPTSVFAEGSDDCVYVIQPGDNLFRISVNHNTTVDAIRASNPQLRGDLIQPGDRLNLPDCVGGSPGVVAPPVEQPPASAPVTGGTTHTVRAGETLFVIAQRYNVTIESIVQANTLTNPDRLSVGQQLIIPGN